jgi:hypothetical protein
MSASKSFLKTFIALTVLLYVVGVELTFEIKFVNDLYGLF